MQASIATVLALVLLLAFGCSGPDPDSYEVTESRIVEILDFGATVPPSCEPSGSVRVGARDVDFFDRLTGAQIEAFYTDLLSQLASTGATLLIPTGDHPTAHAAEMGLEFLGEAYICPGGAPAT